ncbi:MAG: M48 family metallopeptidase [Chloroflexi bacterium]|nr:M48 family metallopeptidase [Chloroflexota bacterium]
MTDSNTPVALDPERQTKAKEYNRIKRRLWLVNVLWEGLYAAAWLGFGWALALKGWLTGFTASPWLLVAAFAVVYGGVDSLLTTPLSYYSGFVLPHRYELSTQSLKDWLLDRVKGLAVGLPIGLLVLEFIYLFLRSYPDMWWLWAAGFMLVFSVLLSNLAPVLIMPIFNKFVPLDEQHRDLAERLIRLAERAHTRVKGVYKFDMSRRTKSANAALTGIGNTRRIILGDTLIDKFTPDEIETVLAHELGHHVNRDIPLFIAFGTVSTLVGLYLASLAMRWGAAAFGFESIADPAALPLLALVLGGYGLLTMPLENGFSRWRERLADRYALQATGKAAAFANAFTRLANQNLADVDPEAWVVWLFYNHPPLNQRIESARRFAEAG